jgi:hypothetical protein
MEPVYALFEEVFCSHLRTASSMGPSHGVVPGQGG